MSLFRLLVLMSLFTPFAYRATTDDGAGLDPHGRPQAAAACDDGNGFDPHGGCRPGNALDGGPIMDPNG
ncbi:MAG: hypothetical protein M3P06_17480 [Acidobacteriota bacterium]|nr:hypothetical protein [Acidobacteriota bacterium]